MNRAARWRTVLGLLMAALIILVIQQTEPAAAEAEPSLPGAAYLVDEDFSFLYTRDPGEVYASGWDVRRAGGKLEASYNDWFKIVDTSSVLPVSISRYFQSQTTGKLTMEYRFKTNKLIDNVKWQLLDDESAAFSLMTDGANLKLETAGGQSITLQAYTPGTEYGVKVVADLDSDQADVYVNGVKKAAAASFKQSAVKLNRFILTTGAASKGEVYFSPLKIYKGYTVNEKLISVMPGYLPEDWSAASAGGQIAVQQMNSSTRPDIFSLRMNAANATTTMSLGKTFPEQTGKLAFEYKLLIPVKRDGIAVQLTSGSADTVSLVTYQGQWSYVNALGQSVPFYSYLPNQWVHIKVLADTSDSTADLYVNGKLQAAGIGLKAALVDGIKFTVSPSAQEGVWLDDILLYKLAPESGDYVPAPVKVTNGQQLVGAQSCPMWREGHHLGWDRINPYPERVPYLGFYDEGNPETADWEIKWSVEHGIDFQLYCWFRPSGGEGSPIKNSYLDYSLHDGFFNAKYSDQMKFAIAWENSASKVANSSDFRQNLIPYWIEYYFKDPRYLKVDNKPVLSIYSMSGLKRDFGGSIEAVRAEIDYLRLAVKAAGFNDILLITTNHTAESQAMQEREAVGFDAVYAYSYGVTGSHKDNQIRNMTEQNDTGIIDVLPTMMMGRDDTPWGLGSGSFNTPEEFSDIGEWIRDTYIPSLPVNHLGRKMVMLDNWNEYGEGHFIIPAGLAGFGYVDAIRDVFTAGPGHTDVRPTADQLDRVQVLYPPGRLLVRAVQATPVMTNVYSKQWSFETTGDSEGWVLEKQIDPLVVTDGSLKGTATGTDPGIRSADALNIEAVNVPYIRIRMSSDIDSGGQMFFITNTDANWDEAKSMSFTVKRNTAGGFSDYILDTWKNPRWTGKIRSIRIDPLNSPGSFAIDDIGLVDSPLTGVKLYVDGQLQSYADQPIVIDGQVMIPAKQVLKTIGGLTEWDPAAQSVIAALDSNVLRFTAGSTTGYMNDQPMTLEHAPVMLPSSELLIPATALRQLLGYGVVWNAASSEVTVIARGLQWNYNSEEAWTANSYVANFTASGGFLTGTSTAANAAVQSPAGLSLDASGVKRVRVQYRNDSAGTEAKLYFTTASDPAWNEAKSYSLPIAANETNTIEYVLDTGGNPYWSGVIDQLRFVPNGAAGTFAIDSIRLEADLNVSVKGDNQIIDPGMEDQAFRFTGYNTVRQFSQAVARSGHQSLKITKLDAYGSVEFPISVEKGKSYYYSAWGRLAPESAANEWLRLCLQYKVDGVSKQIIVLTSPALSSTEWRQVNGTYTIEEAGTVTEVKLFFFTDRPAAADTYYLDDVEVRPVTNTDQADYVHVSEVGVNRSSVTLGIGRTEMLIPSIQPSNAMNQGLIWTSSDPAVASVDVTGAVYGRSSGTATITGISMEGGKKAASVFTVMPYAAVTGVVLNTAEAVVSMGQTLTLEASVLPSGAIDPRVVWSTSNPNIATVSVTGVVYGAGPGVAYITATTVDGAHRAVSEVRVPMDLVLEDNLVTDPGMEGSAVIYSGWEVTRSLSAAEAHRGSQSLKVTKTNAYGSIQFPAAISQGAPYYYSAWVKPTPVAAGKVLKIALQYKVNGVQVQKIILSSPTLSASRWTLAEGVYTITDSGTVTNVVMYMFTDNPAANDTYYLDDVEIRPVSIPVSGVSLNTTALELGPGMTYRLKASLEPQNATRWNVTWSSDNTEVATVDVTGAVYGKHVGVAHITVHTVDGGKTAAAAVTVREGAPEPEPETVVLTVKPDGTGNFLSPKLANDSIQDSSADKWYVILIHPGVYTENNWVVKPYTTLRGTDRDQVILKGENSASATNSQITNQSTVWLVGTANLENLTITAKNMRYPIHSEDSGNNKNAVHRVKNSHIEHYGNLEAVQYRQGWMAANPGVTPTADLDPTQVWGGVTGVGSHAWGYGSASGVLEIFDNSTFISKATGWYVHNREDFSRPQKNIINNSTIVSTVTLKPIIIQSLGSGTKDEVIFNNTVTAGTYMVQDDSPWITQKPENQYANHADYSVTFNNSTPIGYLDGHRGRALALFSSRTGSSSSVRVSGDAVPDILGAYETRDGAGGLKGYLYGYWDISGIKVGLSSNIDVNNTLGRRLGDRTLSSKTLQVTFEDTTTKTITFNENYTARPNSYILGKINEALGAAGQAVEYNVTANEYYPQMSDKQILLHNNTAVGIPRFAAVCLDIDNTTLRLMKATDSPESFVGITLQRILPGESGKVLTEGILSKAQLYGFSGSINAGSKISIGDQDGSLKANAGSPALLEGIQTDWAYFKRKAN